MQSKDDGLLPGLEVIGEGATTKIYRDGDKAIKLYVDAPYDEAENEAARQLFAYNAGLPVPFVYTPPRRLAYNAVALDMDYIDGRPIINREMGKDERNGAIQTMAELQCRVHGVDGDGLPVLHERLYWKIKSEKRLDNARKEKLLAKLEELDDGSRKLCHGDFHALNILYDGGKHWIIDWVDAASGNPLADACRSYLFFKQYITRSAGTYLRAFCKVSGAAESDILAWLPVIAAARLRENMDEKARQWLLGLVNSG